MKNRFIVSAALMITGVLLFNPTIIAQTVNKKILGKWKAEFVEQFPKPDSIAPSTISTPANVPEKAQATAQSSKEVKGKPGTEAKSTKKDPAKVIANINRMALNSSLTINPDMTYILKTPKKESKGIYKVKRKGKLVLCKDAITKKTTKIKIVDVTDNTLVIIQNYQIGDLKITLKKVE